jgi:iron complex transport system substrate-binding protein
MRKNYRFLIILFFLLTRCIQNKKQKTSFSGLSTQYAAHFRLQKFDGFDLLEIINAYPDAPEFSYLLIDKTKKTAIPDSLQNKPKIFVPLNSIVVTSTTHLPALKILEIDDKLTGFPNLQYISEQSFIDKIKTGQIKEVGNGAQLNTEILLLLHPDLVMTFNSGNRTTTDTDVLIKNEIPVLFNGDWLETNPLGRAEWIKVFGALFKKEKKADSIFKIIENNYLSLKEKISTQKSAPVVFQGGIFGDKWFIPGGNSYAAQLIKDAGGKYLWDDDKHNGGIQLNYENVLLQLPKADIWLNPGMFENKQQLTKEFPAAKDIPAYQNDRIFSVNLTKGKNGGIIYFEQSNLHPDWILNDLYHIFYPKNDSYIYHFYQKLPEK